MLGVVLARQLLLPSVTGATSSRYNPHKTLTRWASVLNVE